MKHQSLKSIHIISLGFCAVCTQSVFIREMMALFTGTELVIGALLAGWLFWVGLGGILGGRLVRFLPRRDFSLLAWLSALLALLLPVTVIAIRLGRGRLACPPGIMPPFIPAVVFAVLVMAPFGFFYGTLYNVASDLWRVGAMGIRGGVSRVYIWEAVGSLAGAVAFSFVLLPLFSQLQVAFIVAYLIFAVVNLRFTWAWLLVRRAFPIALLGVVLIFIAPVVDKKSIESVYAGYGVERFLSSRYGEIVAVSKDEVLSFFSSGGRLFSMPEPERSEEVTHIPLLMHNAPSRVLLIGGSLGGGWGEVVEHPSVEVVDCLELDGELLRLALEMEARRDTLLRDAYSEGGYTSPQGWKLNFIIGDGRFFLAKGLCRYDVVILNAPPPVNLQWNRYYTEEFFELVKKSLLPGGLFAFSHPSSENFLSGEQVRVLKSLEVTLKQVFQEVIVLPGFTAHFISAEWKLDAGVLLGRIEERGIRTRFISEDFLPYRFSRERIDFLRSNLNEAGDVRVNKDAEPTVPLYELLLEGKRMGSSLMGCFDKLLGASPVYPPAVMALILLLLFVVARASTAARLSVWTVGFCSFLFQILVLLAYQSFSGHLYHAIVLMTALFMGGASLGAWIFLRSDKCGKGSLRAIHITFIVLSLSLIGWLFFLKSSVFPQSLGTAVFMLYSACGGFLTGSYYPIVVRTALPEDGSAVPATFYSWDMFGACAGGLLGGVLLFPVTGLVGAALFVVFIHAVAAVLLVGKW